MKNKFLIFFLLFAVSLLIYFNSQVSFAAITSVTTDTPAVGLTSATLKGTSVLTDNVNETYDGRGFNFGTASAAAGNYTSSSTETGTFTGGATFTHPTTSLSRGTVYYFRAYAASSTINSIVYGSESSFLTGIDEPTSLAKSSAASQQSSISLSWTAGAGADNTIVRHNTDQYPTSITNGTQGYKGTGSSAEVSNLTCGVNYYFRAWSSTTDSGLSTSSNSYAQLSDNTNGCPTAASGGGGRTCMGPNVSDNSLVINQGAVKTQTREVELALKAEDATLMSICNNSSFLGCSLESYSTTKSWTLTEGDGQKTVYARFVSDCGMNSLDVSDTITLETPAPTPLVPTPTPTTTPEPAPAPTPEPTPAPTPEPTPTPVVEKPISEMTKEELTAKIAEIMAQIEVLQVQLTELKEMIAFEVNLKYGDRGDEIVKLQEALIKEGILDEGLNTGRFGPLTKTAVIKFQEKYAPEILTPLGLTKGTGFVGSSTRVKLNELFGK